MRFCLIRIGKQAIEAKRGKESGGSEIKGPESKEKRRSLKEASQVMKKAMIPARRWEERGRGRREKRERIGRRERSLVKPLGNFEEMKKE